MDYTLWIFITALSMILSLRGQAAGQKLREPRDVKVVMLDGEVTMVWVPPTGAPPQVHYRVQISKYGGNITWKDVPGCNWTQSLQCDLTNSINSVKDMFMARVQMVNGLSKSSWVKLKKFSKRESKLSPPNFTLSADSASVVVIVHRKPGLEAVFPTGLKYNYHLLEKGQNLTINQSFDWKRAGGEEEEKDVEFGFLMWGYEYCVRVEVEDISGTAASRMSSEKCIILPPPVWYIPIMIALAPLLVIALSLLALLLHCFLRRPEKLPSTLKCPGGAWLPLSLGEVPVETVTDKGWLLITHGRERRSSRMEAERSVMEKEKEEERRQSLDSGVSMEQPPSEKDGHVGREAGRDVGRRQDDSGCGSLGETDSESRSSRERVSEERPLLQRETEGPDSPSKEDSGVGLECQYSGAAGLEQDDCQAPPALAMGGGDGYHGDGYRSQKPSFVIPPERKDSKEDTVTDTSIALAVGYRPGGLSCVCLGRGFCMRCQALPRPTEQHSTGSYPTTDTPIPSVACLPHSYLKKGHPQMVGDPEQRDSSFVCHIPLTESSDSTPLLTSVPLLPPLCGGLDCSINTVSLSLQDVEVAFI
ncbi:hypothetical protein AGOR_G00121890 [Albula goreensis]|uniref:Fibronectin type-III domain-containing protein n=1 Tax=Albula goreensis TaxID=1534307 RepID=A0A8T3D933_9TELE|nr:hypothetical protein AGOR_G00121890 [Albula goreensis]